MKHGPLVLGPGISDVVCVGSRICILNKFVVVINASGSGPIL